MKTRNRLLSPDPPAEVTTSSGAKLSSKFAQQTLQRLKGERTDRDPVAPPAEPTPEPTPDPTPEPAPAPEPSPAPEPAPEPTAPKVQRMQKKPAPAPAPTYTPPPPRPAPAPAPVPAPAPAPASPPVSLSPDQQEEYDLALFAEKTHPDKYAGQGQKYLDFLDKLKKWPDENPDEEPDGDEFKLFVKRNKPTYKMGERNALFRRMVTEQATSKAEAAVKKETDELRREQERMKREPQVNRQIAQWSGSLKGMQEIDMGARGKLPAIGDQVIAECGPEMDESAYLSKHPIAGPIWLQHYKAGVAFLRTTNDLEPFKSSNPTHAWLLQFLNNSERDYAQHTDRHNRNGKQWVTRAEFVDKLGEGTADHFWCFEFEEIAKLLVFNAQVLLKAEHDRIIAAGYLPPEADKKPVEQPAAPQAPADPKPSPKAGSPRVGASPSKQSQTTAPSSNEHSFVAGLRSRVGIAPKESASG